MMENPAPPTCLLTVNAGTVGPKPDRCPTWRARYGVEEEKLGGQRKGRAHPKNTWSTSTPGGSSARAAFPAIPPSSAALRSFSLFDRSEMCLSCCAEECKPATADFWTHFPPYAPKGVRLDETMNDSGRGMCEARERSEDFMVLTVVWRRTGETVVAVWVLGCEEA
jgi:hypothetical protein